MRIVFMGTPAFALPALRAIIAAGHEVVAAYSQPSRPAGRGLKLHPSPVQQLAQAHAIPVRTPVSLKSAEAQAEFSALKADIAVVAAYGLLLPQAILDAPRHGCLNIHPSDLPRWRGAAPIQRTLMAGDSVTACCIMQMDAGLDTGPLLHREPFAIPPAMNGGELHDAMADLGAKLLIETLAKFAGGESPIPISQSPEGITYAAKITKAERTIDWSQPAVSIVNHVRGLAPAPAATTSILGEQVKILVAHHVEGDATKPSGITLDDRLRVNAGDGNGVLLTHLQRPGRLTQESASLLQALPVTTGTLLGSQS